MPRWTLHTGRLKDFVDAFREDEIYEDFVIQFSGNLKFRNSKEIQIRVYVENKNVLFNRTVVMYNLNL